MFVNFKYVTRIGRGRESVKVSVSVMFLDNQAKKIVWGVGYKLSE